MGKGRRVPRWLAVVGITFAILALFELRLRLVWFKQVFIPAGIADAQFHHRLRPNEDHHFSSEEFDVTIRTNRYGLRQPDPELPKPAGVTRLLLLGDSFTFGFPIPDGQTFADLIEEQLNARGMRVDVVNGGVSGYSPTLHYLSLRDQFLAFEPDAVILWLDFGDVQEDAWFQKNLLYGADGALLRCDPRYVHGRFDWWEYAVNRSTLAKWVNNKILRTWQKMRILGVGGYLKAALRGERAKVAIARLKAAQRTPEAAESDRFLLLRESATVESLRPQWALTARYLVMIRDLLAERQIPFLLGVYPYGMLVGPDQWAEGRTAWGFEKGRVYEARAALELLQEFSSAEQIPLINTIEAFKAAAASEQLFYDWDGHMTPAGHRVLAERVVNDPLVLSTVREAAGLAMAGER